MSNDNETTLTTKGLDKILKVFQNNMPSVKVGVLGTKAAREGPMNNASIGAIHEFGQGHMPERSFLRAPISKNLDKELETSGVLDEEVLKEAMNEASFIPYMKKVAFVAEGIVSEAFETGGSGTWPKSDMTRKKNHQTLVEEQELRNSITSEVK